MSVTVFAPATVANVAVGFDILGFALDSVGDRITARKIKIPNGESSIRVISRSTVPDNPARNTATVGLLQMVQDLNLSFGFEITVEKGIPISSGMGGSAASAVGGIVAANALLSRPLSDEALLKYALMGEAMASGSAHLDNIAPCFFGGLTLVQSMDPLRVVSIPVPKKVFCVLVHPHLRLETRESRKVLKKEVSLSDHVQQSSRLAGFVAGCFQNDLELVRHSLEDVLIEPQRASLIPGFAKVKAAALKAGALGCSISGSGPSVFAWVDSEKAGKQVKKVMTAEFKKVRLESDGWVSRISTQGAKVIS